MSTNFSHIDSGSATRAPIPDATTVLAQIYQMLLELVFIKLNGRQVSQKH